MKSSVIQTLWERRDRLSIMAEMMEEAKGGRLKTQIMYGVNLSFSQIREHLLFLTEMGFLKVRVENRKRIYETTAKGNQYLESYRELSSLLRKQQSAAPSA